ncbi:MAG: hypothetical protein GY794_04105 [bacterium]|nr:hypothetical protein [bacterium]
MITPRKIITAFDNRMNPITVKELRQTVRSGLVFGGFLLFILSLLLVMVWSLLSMDSVGLDFQGGPEIFGYLVFVLMIISTVMLPIHASSRLAGERKDPHARLLFTTTLSTWKVVRGKMQANVILAIIIFSTCAPFVTFTYLLRGIDFPTIFMVMATCFMISITALNAAIFAGALPIGRIIRIIMTLFCLWLVMSFISMLAFSFRYGLGRFVFGSGSYGWGGLWEAWPILLSLLTINLLIIGLFHVATVALLTPPAANRTLPLRLYLMFAWLLTGTISMLWANESGTSEHIHIWGIMSWTVLIFCMFVAIGERTSWGPRVRRQIPKNVLLRIGSFILYTGAGGGMVWIFFMIAMTALIMGISNNFWPTYLSTDDFGDTITILSGFTLFCYAYCMTAILIKPRMFRWLADAHTGVLVLLLFCIGYVFPMLIGYIILSSSRGGLYTLNSEIGFWNMLNPFMLFDRDCRDTSMVIAFVWTVLVSIFSIPWYTRQVQQFIPWQRGEA